MSRTVHIYACTECGDRVTPGSRGVVSQVIGWVASRDAGGTNHLINQKFTGLYAHRACIVLPPNMQQEGLF